MTEGDRRNNYDFNLFQNNLIKKKARKNVMKKLFVIMLTVFMLAACSSTTPNKGQDTDQKDNQTVETTFEDELIEPKTIIIGTSPDYPPYESLDAQTNELVGFDVDLLNALVAKLDGYEIEWRYMEFDTIVSAVQTKQVDLGVSGFSYDPEKQVAFTDIYYNAGQTVLVKKDSNIHSASDLNGKVVAAQIGTTCLDLAKEIEGAEVVTATDAKILVEALKTGAYDGVCLDTTVAMSYVNTDPNLTVLDEELASDSYAIVVNSEHTKLVEKLNELLADFMQTEEYQALCDKWGM